MIGGKSVFVNGNVYNCFFCPSGHLDFYTGIAFAVFYVRFYEMAHSTV